jgi:hypothetical protein
MVLDSGPCHPLAESFRSTFAASTGNFQYWSPHLLDATPSKLTVTAAVQISHWNTTTRDPPSMSRNGKLLASSHKLAHGTYALDITMRWSLVANLKKEIEKEIHRTIQQIQQMHTFQNNVSNNLWVKIELNLRNSSSNIQPIIEHNPAHAALAQWS